MATTNTNSAMTVKISMNDKGNPAGKLADAELHFTEGVRTEKLIRTRSCPP